MSAADDRSRSPGDEESSNPIFRRAKTVLRMFLAMGCLVAGAIGLFVTLLLVLAGEIYWPLGTGLVSGGALYLAWLLFSGWKHEGSDHPETPPPDRDPKQRNTGERETGRTKQLEESKTTGSWLKAGVMMWFFLLPTVIMGPIFVGLGGSSLVEAVRGGSVHDGVSGGIFLILGVGFLYAAGHMVHMIWTSDEGPTKDKTASADGDGTYEASKWNPPDSHDGSPSTSRPPGRSFRRSGIRQIGRKLGGTVRAIGCGWLFLLPVLTGVIYGEVLAVRGYLAGRNGLFPLLAISVVLLVVLTAIGSFLVETWRGRGESDEEETKALGDYQSAWSTRRIPASKYPKSTPNPVGTLLFGLLLGAGVGFGAYYGFRQGFWTEDIGATIGFTVIVGLPIVLAVVFLLRTGYSAVRHRRRYDRGVFEMDTYPAVLGGTLRGTVETGMALEDRPPEGFRVKVTCGRIVGGETSSFRRLWQTEKQVDNQVQVGGKGIAVPIEIDLPEDQPPSKLDPSSKPIHWRMTIRADGVDPPYEQLFKIPVLSPDHRLARYG